MKRSLDDDEGSIVSDRSEIESYKDEIESDNDQIEFTQSPVGGEYVTQNSEQKPKRKRKKPLTRHFKRDRFKDEFDLAKEIGSGGYGTVYKARHKKDDKYYAIKKIMATNSQNKDLKRCQSEVKTLAKSCGEYVVQYFDSWIEKKVCLYIQMELCFDNLKNIIDKKRQCFRPKPIVIYKAKPKHEISGLDYFISTQLLKELLECVQHLHESDPPIMHRDLKPANVLITERPTNGRFLKLCDFGLAKYAHLYTQTHTGGQGTIDYMAPEVRQYIANGQKYRYSVKADIYSLSKIAHQLFDVNLDISSKHEYLKQKWEFLKNVIVAMNNLITERRPLCADVLKDFKSWGISHGLNDQFNLDFETNVLEQDTFLRQYFNEKLKYTEKEDKIISPSKSGSQQPKITQFLTCSPMVK